VRIEENLTRAKKQITGTNAVVRSDSRGGFAGLDDRSDRHESQVHLPVALLSERVKRTAAICGANMGRAGSAGAGAGQRWVRGESLREINGLCSGGAMRRAPMGQGLDARANHGTAIFEVTPESTA